MDTNILGFAGSLRRGSLNRQLLEAAARELPPPGRLLHWTGLDQIPPYNEDEDGSPAQPIMADLRQRVAQADGLLIATPEYNHSIPGVLKNALDWLSRPYENAPLAGKPVAVIGASMSPFGAKWAQEETRKVLKAIGARVIPEELPVPHAQEAFAKDGRLADGALRERMARVLSQLVAEASAPDDQGEAVA